MWYNIYKRTSFLSWFDLLGVEFEFSAFQNVSVGSAWLTGPWADASQKSLLTELFSNLWINDSDFLSFSYSGLSSSWSCLFLDLSFLALSGDQVDTVVVQVPLGEWGSVNGDNAVLYESLGSDQLVVGSVVHDVDDSGFSGGGFWGPVEVTFFESEGSELVVTSSDSDSSNSGLVVDELSVSDGSGFLEGSLLFMDWHSATSWSSLMSWISGNTHFLWSQNIILLIWNILIFINFCHFEAGKEFIYFFQFYILSWLAENNWPNEFSFFHYCFR